ncbi:MAG: hypothetical protein NUW22_06885 [Acidobacteria bacterium]|nr:hypothetical protein [Acidobacteriota bacterium]
MTSCYLAGDSVMARSSQHTPTLTLYVAVVLAGLTCVATPAAGQVSIDIGVHAGAACLNGGPECAGGFVGPVASAEWRRRVALRIRYVAVDLEEDAFTFGVFTIRRQGRRGQLLLGELLYEFRPRSRIQPVVGVSLGRRVFQDVTTCEPVSCAEASASPGGPGVFGGVLKNSRFTAGGIAGLSVRAGERVTIQAMFGFHDLWQEHGETVEGAVLLSISVWRSR